MVTTGIYCRAGCGGRPRAANVRSFPLPAAAEAAGYRSCLQCRPYRQPLWVPATAPELVCRAVRVILAGGLDRANEEQLGRRIGISGRHLRRLFVEHLGVTPDGLARSARAHFARRLLDDTDLPIVQVAFAAGFGSVRQFNRACKEIFREPPRALRARRRKRDRLVADGGLLLRLPYEGELDWPALLAELAGRAIPGVEHVSGETYRRTIVVDGDPGVVELRPGADAELLLRFHLPHWGGLIHLVERARRVTGLDLVGESRCAPRLLGSWDGFETGVRAIISQGAPRADANALAGELAERLGAPVPGLEALGLSRTFPDPHVVADGDLSGLGLPARCRATIGDFARAVRDEAIPLDGSWGYDRLVAALTAVPGLEAPTAQSLAARLGVLTSLPLAGSESRAA